jgi:hypothetical protein
VSLTPRTRRRLARAAILGGPFALLFLLVRAAAPPLSSWVRNRLAGEGYATVLVAGREADYEVHAAGPDAEAHARAGAALLDRALEDVVAAGAGFGLRAPARTVRLMLLEPGDFHGYSGVAVNDELAWNGGFFDPGRLEIALSAGHDEALGLRHEGTHLLFSIASRSGLSSWLSEGLACYFEHRGLPRRPVAGALAVSDVIGASGKDFASAANAAAYRDAELLVTWLLDAAGPDVRGAFVRHVRLEMEEGPLGSSPSDFAKSVVGVEPAALDARVAAWAAHPG